MLTNSIRIFREELDRLEKHLSRLKGIDDVMQTIQNSTLVEHQKEHAAKVLEKSPDEKIFDYNANIISLYGYWEKFIESVIKEYLESLKSLHTSNDDKNTGISNRYKKSLLHLLGNKRSNHKLKHLKDSDLIDGLYKGCVLGKNEYIAEAFYQSGGNYNYSETKDCLLRLGLKDVDSEMKYYPSIVSYCISIGMSFNQVKSSSSEAIYKKLDNLVVYRNEIAHGSSDGSNLLDSDQLLQYVKFMEAIGCAVNDYLNDDLLKENFKVADGYLTKVRRYFPSINTAEIKDSDYYLDTSKIVLCYAGKKNYPHYQKLSIRSIWVNGSPYAERFYLSCNSTDSVTIVFDKLVKRGYLLKFVQ